MIPLAATVDPSTLVSSGVSWFLGIAGTLFGAFVAYHAIKHLISHKSGGIMPLIELLAVAIVAGIFIFYPHAFQALAGGFAQILNLPTG
jgi:hypothetical protein